MRFEKLLKAGYDAYIVSCFFVCPVPVCLAAEIVGAFNVRIFRGGVRHCRSAQLRSPCREMATCIDLFLVHLTTNDLSDPAFHGIGVQYAVKGYGDGNRSRFFQIVVHIDPSSVRKLKAYAPMYCFDTL